MIAKDPTMALRALFSILFSASLMLKNGVGSREMSKPENFDHHNRPVVKTVKTEYGDKYDCIDFYKQPAFDHPALKNHDFHPQMRPTSRPKQMPYAHTSSTDAKKLSFGLKDEACPSGTVPIRRVNQDDQQRIESFTKNYSSMIHPYSSNTDGSVYLAIGRTKADEGPQVFHGVGANFTLHNPPILNNEYTSGVVYLMGGSDSIHTGWTVNPILYKDTKTRMFIYTDAGESHCYNTYCPGFVIVRSDIPLDSVLNAYSEPKGDFSYFSFYIFQDPANGNWWLDVGQDYTEVGFWPSEIFTGLAESGSYVACGGEAFQPADVPERPNMGTGFMPGKSKAHNAYCLGFTVVNDEHKVVVADHTEGFTNMPESYLVVDQIILKAVHYVNETIEIGDSDTHKVDKGSKSNLHLEAEHRVIYGGPQIY